MAAAPTGELFCVWFIHWIFSKHSCMTRQMPACPGGTYALMGRVGHKCNVQQNIAGTECRSMLFIGSSQGRYPNKGMEQRPEGSEEPALRISEGGVIQRGLCEQRPSSGYGPGCGRGGRQQCGMGREEGRADKHGSGEKLLLTPCLLFEQSMLCSFPWPLHLEPSVSVSQRSRPTNLCPFQLCPE